MHEIAVRTFMARRNQNEADWSFDPIQAARLGLAGQVKSSLRALTTRYQLYPSGLARFFGDEFYVEQIGVLTAALHESLVQNYSEDYNDGLLRIAPAWPEDWSADATSRPSPRRKGPRPDNKRSTPGCRNSAWRRKHTATAQSMAEKKRNDCRFIKAGQALAGILGERPGGTGTAAGNELSCS